MENVCARRCNGEGQMKLNYKMIGKRIQKRRKRSKLTQEQLAERTERSPAFIGHIERGTRKMSIETLCEIALALNCPTDEILGLPQLKADSNASARELLALAQALAKERE